VLPPSVADGQTKVACVSLAGKVLVFDLAELKLQPNGGRGLTLMDVDEPDALVSVAAFGESLRVLGTGRGGKPREELLRGAALEAYVGRRARKGKLVGAMKTQRVLAGG
jgi:topoisomerase-4 subunit A